FDALRPEAAQRPGDCVARVDGDEFVVLLSGLVRAADARTVADRLLGAIRIPFQLAAGTVTITASSGIAIAESPLGDESAEALIARAQAAMHEAKARGSEHSGPLPGRAQRPRLARAQVAAPALAPTREPRRLQAQSELFDAVQSGSFELLYQPRIDVGSGAVVALEALLRWRRGQALVAPEAFLPLARESRLLRAIGCWVIEAACLQQEAWRAAGTPAPAITVNVDASDLGAADFVASSLAALDAHGLPASALRLEACAADLAGHGEALRDNLQALHAHGVGLGVDGIGGLDRAGLVAGPAAGVFEWAGVDDLPLATVALDRRLVARIDADVRLAAEVRRVCASARERGLRSVAVGVERASQLQALQHAGCDQVQGFLLAMPMPPAQYAAWMRQREARLAAHVAPARDGAS
ncbi:MAG: bifunctional diguanylate cyclase/phosphodiesterase, partial [Burkholderiales bacterium]